MAGELDSEAVRRLVERQQEGASGDVLHLKNGQTYTGVLVAGAMHGRGRMVWPDATSYDGTFERNAIEGDGVYRWDDGAAVYRGQVRQGRRHGRGVQTNQVMHGATLAKTIVYDGTWRDGSRDGTGRLTIEPGGVVYDGQWQGGCRHGHGRLTYESGNVYDGAWQHDRKHGQGVMRWTTLHEVYDGSWQHDKPDGYGVHTWFHIAGLETNNESAIPHLQTYNQYSGQYRGGQRSGYGTFRYASGAEYSGEWANNVKHGRGVLQYENGLVVTGTWTADRLIDQGNQLLAKINRELTIECADLIPPEPDAHTSVDGSAFSQSELIGFVLLRHHSELRSMYYFYCTMQLSGQNDFRSLSLYRLWVWARHMHICSPRLTIAQIDRLVRFRRITLFGSQEQPEAVPNIHDPSSLVLLREFFELIVRLAFELFPTLMPLSNAVQHFCEEIIIPRFLSVKEHISSGNVDFLPVSASLLVPSHLHRPLRNLFDQFSTQIDTSDRTLSAKSLIKILKKQHMPTETIYQFMNGTRSLGNHVPFVQHRPIDLVEDEFLYEEFLEIVVNCATISPELVSDGDASASNRMQAVCQFAIRLLDLDHGQWRLSFMINDTQHIIQGESETSVDGHVRFNLIAPISVDSENDVFKFDIHNLIECKNQLAGPDLATYFLLHHHPLIEMVVDSELKQLKAIIVKSKNVKSTPIQKSEKIPDNCK